MGKLICFLLLALALAVEAPALTIAGGYWNTVNVNNGVNGFVYSTATDYNIHYTTPGSTTIATFTMGAGESLHILGLGIGGDVGGNSSTVVYQLVGGGLNFVFSAGSSSYGSPNLFLGAATYNFVYQRGGVADMTATAGSTVYLNVLLNIDPDGQHINSNVTDPFGNVFNDSSYTSSRRVWINYTTNTNVPEPSSLLLCVVAFLAYVASRRF